MQHLGQLGISSLVSLTNLSLSRLGELARGSLGSRKAFHMAARKHWEKAELPSVGKAWNNVWDQGEGNSVAKHKTVLLQWPCPG